MEDLDVLHDVLTARLTLLDELIALIKLLGESILELREVREVHYQLRSILWCIAMNPGSCPFLLSADICLRTEALRQQLIQVEERAQTACVWRVSQQV